MSSPLSGRPWPFEASWRQSHPKEDHPAVSINKLNYYLKAYFREKGVSDPKNHLIIVVVSSSRGGSCEVKICQLPVDVAGMDTKLDSFLLAFYGQGSL